MGQTEGKQSNQIQYHTPGDPAETPPTTTTPAQPIPSTTQPVDTNTTQENPANSNSTPNTNTPPNVGAAIKSNAEVLKRSTDELVGGINKLGANLISTAKGANLNTLKAQYNNVSANAFKKAATAVEGAIVTVKAGIVKSEEEPELEALAKMPLFFPLIRTSVPLSDLAKGLPVQKTTISYLDPASILTSLLDYQRFLVVTGKMIAARQAELINKVKDSEMSSGRKALFTLAMNVTDMRHFNTQFSEVARFHINMERTKQSINDLLGMFEKLNALLPTEAQLESFSDFAASNPTLSSHGSRNYSLSPSPHSSLNYASLSLPSSHSSGSFKNFNFPSSHSSGKFTNSIPTSPTSHSSMNFSNLAPANAAISTTSTTTNSNTTNTTLSPTISSTTSSTTNSETANSETTNSIPTNPETTNATTQETA